MSVFEDQTLGREKLARAKQPVRWVSPGVTGGQRQGRCRQARSSLQIGDVEERRWTSLLGASEVI